MSNLLHWSLTLSYLLLVLHNCVSDFHGRWWMPVYSISKGNGNLQVQFIPAQTAVTRQEQCHHVISSQRNGNLTVSKSVICCCQSGNAALLQEKELAWGHAGDTRHQTFPSCFCVCSLGGQHGHRSSPEAFICKAMASQHWYSLRCTLLATHRTKKEKIPIS